VLWTYGQQNDCLYYSSMYYACVSSLFASKGVRLDFCAGKSETGLVRITASWVQWVFFFFAGE
jgi:hypothetical protein